MMCASASSAGSSNKLIEIRLRRARLLGDE
jgi:hypothetical protein